MSAWDVAVNSAYTSSFNSAQFVGYDFCQPIPQFANFFLYIKTYDGRAYELFSSGQLIIILKLCFKTCTFGADSGTLSCIFANYSPPMYASERSH